MSFAYLQNLPGIDTAVETSENEFLFGPAHTWNVMGVQLDSGAVDSGNTPTTTLRKGLILGVITSTGLYADYDPTATDGTQNPVGILAEAVNMYDARAGAVRAKAAKMVYAGHVKAASLVNLDEYARLVLGPRCTWDDLRFTHLAFTAPVAKTADYTVLSTDSGKAFTTLGASGAVIFTLPAVGSAARGYRFRFHNAVDQNMTVTAPAGKLITFNNAAATSVAFSTAGNKIGATVEIVATPDGAKYIAIPSGANTMTVA